MMGRIRIKGLVAFANAVQRRLSQPIARSELEELREDVTRLVSDVKRHISARRSNVRALPGPSRRAFVFLRDLRFDKFTAVSWDQITPQPPIQRLIGVTARVEAHCDLIAQIHDRPLVSELVRSDFRRYQPIAENHTMTKKSRDHWAWFCLLSQSGYLSRYVESLRMLTETLHKVAPKSPWVRPIEVHYRPIESAYRMRAYHNRTRVILPTPFIGLDIDQTRMLGRIMFLQDRSLPSLHDLMMSEGYQQVQAELESYVAVDPTEFRGMYHHLGDSFDRVNQGYFDGKMSRPKLSWNKVLTVGKFGHYSFSCDLVMISRSLDREQVPCYVVDHVMHHELLHKKHGIRQRGQRNCSHTPEFRVEERKFEKYREADLFLQKIASGALG